MIEKGPSATRGLFFCHRTAKITPRESRRAIHAKRAIATLAAFVISNRRAKAIGALCQQ
jgi:hypothetical protein